MFLPSSHGVADVVNSKKVITQSPRKVSKGSLHICFIRKVVHLHSLECELWPVRAFHILTPSTKLAPIDPAFEISVCCAKFVFLIVLNGIPRHLELGS